jgi:hypothetical protein
MRQSPDRRDWKPNRLQGLGILCVLGAASLAVAVVLLGSPAEFGVSGFATASRTLNQLTAVMLTCIALVVPLTANLYTPRLVRLYVTHPLIVGGLSVLVLSHLLVLSASFFPAGHPASTFLVYFISGTYLLVLAATLPFLFGISQFLRPAYFLPMLTRRGVQGIARLERGRAPREPVRQLFETIDVVTNVALTGMHRGDRQLVLLALQALHRVLTAILASTRSASQTWRDSQANFVPGLAMEGQAYLKREGIWPEAYVLAQMLKVMESATKSQHEILAEVARSLVESAEQALKLEQAAVVELHLMAFNTLMRQAVEDQDLRRFQNLCYHYRLLIEAFRESPERMLSATEQLLHYGKMAQKQGLHFGLETVLYDLGELVLSLARKDEPLAMDLVRMFAGPLWQESIAAGSLKRKVGWRTLLRVHWEARVAGLEALAELLHWSYLFDDTIHREQLQWVLDENRELHFEFNDRLMRFAHLSQEAEALARKFAFAHESGANPAED